MGNPFPGTGLSIQFDPADENDLRAPPHDRGTIPLLMPRQTPASQTGDGGQGDFPIGQSKHVDGGQIRFPGQSTGRIHSDHRSRSFMLPEPGAHHAHIGGVAVATPPLPPCKSGGRLESRQRQHTEKDHHQGFRRQGCAAPPTVVQQPATAHLQDRQAIRHQQVEERHHRDEKPVGRKDITAH